MAAKKLIALLVGACLFAALSFAPASALEVKKQAVKGENITYVIHDDLSLIIHASDTVAYVNGGTLRDNTCFEENKLAWPVRDGFVFAGWFTDVECTEPAGEVTEGETYYAKRLCLDHSYEGGSTTCSTCGFVREELRANGDEPSGALHDLAPLHQEKPFVSLGESPCSNSEHQWALSRDDSVSASCTNPGFMVYACQNAGCTATKLMATPRLGHEWKTTAFQDPTCTTDGSHTYRCSRMGCKAEKVEYVPALGHGWSMGVPELDEAGNPTGITVFTCENAGCGEHRKTKETSEDASGGASLANGGSETEEGWDDSSANPGAPGTGTASWYTEGSPADPAVPMASGPSIQAASGAPTLDGSFAGRESAAPLPLTGLATLFCLDGLLGMVAWAVCCALAFALSIVLVRRFSESDR